MASAFEDADGDALTLSATELNKVELPQWLSFDPDTNKFIGNPQESDVGSYTITLTATDTEGAQVLTSFGIQVVAPSEESIWKNEIFTGTVSSLLAACVIGACTCCLKKKRTGKKDSNRNNEGGERTTQLTSISPSDNQ